MPASAARSTHRRGSMSWRMLGPRKPHAGRSEILRKRLNALSPTGRGESKPHEIQVAAVLGLQDMVEMELAIAATAVNVRARLPLRLALFQLRRGHQQVDATVLDAELDAVAVAHQRQRPA